MPTRAGVVQGEVCAAPCDDCGFVYCGLCQETFHGTMSCAEAKIKAAAWHQWLTTDGKNLAQLTDAADRATNARLDRKHLQSLHVRLCPFCGKGWEKQVVVVGLIISKAAMLPCRFL